MNIFIGIYLLTIGIVGTLTNTIVLATFYRYRSLISPTALLLINLTICDLGVLGILFPFSSSSNFANKWLYGELGCQVYAFIGFLAGSAHIGTLVLLALDRYRISFQKINKARGGFNYYKWTTGVWLYALFWALMPLIGWGGYSLDSNLNTCGIDWRHNDFAYKSFIIFYFIFGFLIPLCVITVCYYLILRKIRSGSGNRVNPGINGEDIWVKQNTVTIMSIIIIVTFVMSWSPYAVLCLWTVVGEPQTVPFWLTLVPPLFAKTSTLFNPIIYYLTNNRLRGAFLSTITCSNVLKLNNDSQTKVVRFIDIDKAIDEDKD